MSRIIHTCSECGRLAQEKSRTPLLFAPAFEHVNLECGHSYSEEKSKEFSCPDFEFADKTTLYPFQKENVNLLYKANLRGGIFDEMGLGKTISALALLRIADTRPDLIDPTSIYPVACLVKAGLRHQWMREVWIKLGKLALLCDKEPDEALFKLTNIHIYSQDGLRNNENRGSLPYKTIILDECQQIKNPESKRTKAIIDLIQARVIRKDNKNPLRRKQIEMIARDLMTYHGLKERFELFFSELDRNKLGLTECQTVKDGLFSGKITISRFHAENDNENEVIETVLHEIAHAITPGAGHSKAWSDCARSIGSDGKQFANCQGSVEIQTHQLGVRNIIALSGTPIKNHAGEFFPVLNILRPEKFPSHTGFLRYWTRSYFGTEKSVKLGGLSNPTKFGEYTKDFLIRHERKDVLPDLPIIQRNFIVNVLADNLSDSYSDELREFINKYEESKEGQEVSNVLAIMARMRHIVGLSKTSDAVDWISEFIESSNGTKPKLTIFHHHEDVGKILFVGLSRFCRENELLAPIWLSEPGISDETRQARVNEFVSNESKQLLIASTLKSGEGLNLQVCHHALIVERQWNSANEEQAEGRFSRIGSTADKIAVTYLVCAGSIDEMFSEIVERKRQYVGESNAALMGKEVSEVTKYNDTSIMKELAETLFRTGRKKFSLDLK